MKTMPSYHTGEKVTMRSGEGEASCSPRVGEAGTGRVIKSSMTYLGFGGEVMSQPQPMGSLPPGQIGKTVSDSLVKLFVSIGPNPAPCVVPLIRPCSVSLSWTF